MRPSQFNLIRRMCIRMSRQRYYEKVAKKNRKKKQKLLNKQQKLINKQEKKKRRATEKEQVKLCKKMHPTPKVIRTSAFYRNITLAIFWGWFILWFCVISIPTRPSDSFLDSLFLLSGWVMFIPYPLIRYLTKKKKEIAKQDMMNCPFCGSVIASSCKFCTACGSSLIPQQPRAMSVDRQSNILSAEERKALREKYKVQRENDQLQIIKNKQHEDEILRNIHIQNELLKSEDDKANRDQYDELTK